MSFERAPRRRRAFAAPDDEEDSKEFFAARRRDPMNKTLNVAAVLDESYAQLRLLHIERQSKGGICFSRLQMFNDSPDPMTVEFLKDGTVKVDYNSFDMPCDQRSRFRVSLLHIHGHVGDKDLSEVGHANAIVFDQKYGQFLRFEPHANSDTGLGASDILNKKITSIVVGRLQAKYEEPITVLNISDTLPDILQRKEPVCVFMSLLFLEYVGIFSRDESCPSLRWLAKHIAGVLLSEQKTIKYMLWLRVSDERWL